MKKKEIDFLMNEIQKLENEKIIEQRTGAQMRDYYRGVLDESKTASKDKIISVITYLGVILIGLGIILLIANNWEFYSKTNKILVAVIPVLVLQGGLIFTNRYHADNKLLSESMTLFLSLFIGASLAILYQVYNLQGDLSEYLIKWMVMILPLVYLMGANFTGILYLILSIIFTIDQQSAVGNGGLFWVFGAGIMPYYIKKIYTTDKSSSLIFFYNLCYVVWGLFALGIVIEKAIPGLWIILYSSFLFLLYYFAVKKFDQTNPFYFVGKIGMIFLGYLLTFRYFWENIGPLHYRNDFHFNNYGAYGDYVLLGVLLFLVIYAFNKERSNMFKILRGYAWMPVLAVVSFIIASFFPEQIFIVTGGMNVFIAMIGLDTLIIGIRERTPQMANLGILIIGLLMGIRFFDVDMTFIQRATAFLCVGLLFLITNFILKKKLGEHHD